MIFVFVKLPQQLKESKKKTSTMGLQVIQYGYKVGKHDCLNITVRLPYLMLDE